MPRYAVLLSLIALAVMGLPPFGVFAGFIGLALMSPIATSAALLGIVLAWLTSSWYIIDAVQSLLFGRQRPDLRYTDLVQSEFAALLIVVLIVLALGIVPASLFAPGTAVSATGAVMGSFVWNR
jgi:NADH-quinone oxidoreductase subunit M